MPRAVDKHPQARGVGQSLYNPNRSGLASWTDPLSAIDDAAASAGKGIGLRIDGSAAQAVQDSVQQSVQHIRDTLTGIVDATPTDLDNWLLGLLTGASPLDASKISGVLDESAIPDITKAMSSALATLNDYIAQSFSGIADLSDAALPDAKHFMGSAYAQLLQHTFQLQKLLAQSTSTRYAGKSVVVDFGDYPDGPLPSEFSVKYVGTGTSTVGIRGGRAAWNLVNDNNRSAYVMYNDPTDTDYQIVQGTMASPPTKAGSGGTPRIWVVLRADSPTNPQTFVWARAYAISSGLLYKCDIGYTFAGVEHVWDSGIDLGWNLSITCVAGVGAQDRMFEFYAGDTLVKSYNDVAAVSAMGAGYQHWGAYSEMKTGLLGAIGPGTISGTAATDNKPPDVESPTAHMYRTSTTAVNYPQAWTDLPANFWQVVLRESAGVTADTVTGTFKVHMTRAWDIKVQIRLGTQIGAITKLGLVVNGALTQVAVSPAYPNNTGGLAMFAAFTEYLVAEDEVSIATWQNVGFTGNWIQAEATGLETWFSIIIGGSYT
jgi:hypothetical protein